jgi:hypothetical protein
VDFDAGVRKPAAAHRRVPVGGDNFGAVASQGERRRLARTGKPDDEDAARERQRRKKVKSR